MRLDKYLKVSRLIKRRTVANEVADAGRILINGKVAKASQAVNAGDIIEVTFGNRPIKVKCCRMWSRAPKMWHGKCTRSLRSDIPAVRQHRMVPEKRGACPCPDPPNHLSPRRPMT